MALNTAEHRHGTASPLNPMAIAHNPLFTAREKIELLNEIKVEVTGLVDDDYDLGFSADEIDAAIAEIKRTVQFGRGSETPAKGDN